MTNLSITTAWNETAAFVRREAGLILPDAVLLIALHGAAMQLAMPVAGPAQTPELGLWLLLLPVVVVASLVGTIAITYLALRPGASVAEALQVGLRRFVILLGASLLIAFGMMLVLVPLILIFAGGGALAGGDAAAMAGSMMLVFLVFLVVAIALWVRLMMMTPVTAAEAVGPIGIIRRSWQLTAGHFWKLLGFVLLLILATLVVLFVYAGDPTAGQAAIAGLNTLAILWKTDSLAFEVCGASRPYTSGAGRASRLPERGGSTLCPQFEVHTPVSGWARLAFRELAA